MKARTAQIATIAAAISVQYESIGVELDSGFFHAAEEAIPKLANLNGIARANSKRGTLEAAERQRKLALVVES